MEESHELLQSRVTDVVTCPICLERFNSPKSLKCLHTFCLKCIEDYCRDKQPGDEVACPVCRQKCRIPKSGVRGLVSNFFIATLVEERMTTVDVAVQVPCEMCLLECDQIHSNVAASTQYCVKCNKKLCERCSTRHRKRKGAAHRVVPIVESMPTKGAKCDKHKNDDVRLYCVDCKMNICVMCVAEDHQQHRCKNLEIVASGCIEQIDADLAHVRMRADGTRKEISRLGEERNRFLGLSGVENVSERLLATGEKLKQLIDVQVNVLMLEVQSLKTMTCRVIESLKNDVETKLSMFETFSAYCNELKTRCKPCDVTRAANDLHARASERCRMTSQRYRLP